jgi:sugar phosphate isomerase/epimerase
MRRRDVVRLLASALPAAALLRGPAGAARLGLLGLQLYTVRTLMERDVEGTLASVAAIGIREVEFAGYFGRRPEALRRTLRDAGLTAPAAHIPYEDIASDWTRVLDEANGVGLRTVVIPSIDDRWRRTLDDWRRVAEQFNRAAEQARAAGLAFAFHNHEVEFQALEGPIPYDVLLESTDPGLVRFELDLYWIRVGGQDPLAYFRRWPGRFPMVHVKDRTVDGRMVDVGAGAIDWRAVFAHRSEAGIHHYFIEHDEPADPLASVRASYHYLSRLNV